MIEHEHTFFLHGEIQRMVRLASDGVKKESQVVCNTHEERIMPLSTIARFHNNTLLYEQMRNQSL